MRTRCTPRTVLPLRSLSLFGLLLGVPICPARVLDNFDDNSKTGWADFTFVSGFGLPVETSGQFRFEPHG